MALGEEKAAIRIGTSGWNYNHWRGPVYPKGLKQADWLTFLAERLNTVEINATFYRLPKPEYVEHWEQQTPPGFLFAVKGSRYLTHMKRLTETGEALDRFFDLVNLLGAKLGPVLWQLPPNFGRDDDRLARFAGDLPAGHRHAFEFRHPSWLCQEVYDILERAGAALCLPDYPLMEVDRVLTADWTYVRFHYGHGKGGTYSAGQLREWAQIISDYRRDGIDVFAYFNNDQDGHAVDNAVALREMIT